MNNLRKWRLLAEVTQTELGRVCRLTQSMISDFERGRLIPGPELRRRIAKALGRLTEEVFPAEHHEPKARKRV